MAKKSVYECIIIGAGIAGLTAALYAQRKRMDFMLISDNMGGQMNFSGMIDNYPGIKKTTGAEFQQLIKGQMDFNKIKVNEERVSGITKAKNGNFIVKTDKEGYEAKSAIIATGAKPRKLGVPGEEKFAKKGVTYCSICDGPVFSGQDVAIIGGGNAGMEAADFMMNIAKRIYLIDAAENPIAHEYLVERVIGNKKVEYINKAKIKEIYGDNFVKGLKYERAGKMNDLKLSGVIIEAGRDPNTAAFKGIVDMDEHGHIIIDCSTNTSQPGIFAAGDCSSGHEYQYVIAAGQGCMALLKAARYIANRKG